MSAPTYDPSIFNVDGFDRAKHLILNPDGVHTPQERWEVETEYLLGLMLDWMPLKGAAVLDWGCGVGRLAKPLIEQHGCAVLGVDISQSMRSLAIEYVGSPDFLCCDPAVANVLGRRFGMRFDCALAVWTLQHIMEPNVDVALIAEMLKPGGRLFVLNAWQRFVPSTVDEQFQWTEDGFNVWFEIDQHFVPLAKQVPDEKIIPCPSTLWGVFEKPSV